MQRGQGNTHLIGIAFAAIAAILYSTKAIFVKLAYQYDVDSITLLAFRMLSALPFYLLIQMVYRSRNLPHPRPRHWLAIIAAAFLGYYLASFLDFWGLQFVDASLERLILFTYPTFIALLARFWLNERMSRTQWGAVLLSYAGLALVFLPRMGSLNTGSQFFQGVLAILGCALGFAVYMILSQRLIPRFGTTRYTSLAMIIACAFVLGHYAATTPIAQLTTYQAPVYYYGIAMGLVATVIPSYCMNHAIQRIGAARTGIIASIGPVSTIALAYHFLGERLVPIQWLGTLCIILAVTAISAERQIRRTPSV
ncbi:MAG: DMT family transporter [Saprospiraceae bacterium]|nr:DMT family transporter [Saprospiraceae bacterium]